jgi:hypothetical protein
MLNVERGLKSNRNYSDFKFERPILTFPIPFPDGLMLKNDLYFGGQGNQKFRA